MRLTELLGPDRVAVADSTSSALGSAFGKPEALTRLAGMLAAAAHLPEQDVLQVLLDREELQSTGIGEGVAIPHGAMMDLESQLAALLIVPDGLEFGAIDKRHVHILFAVLGPKRATGEHLKTLARVSRLLRDSSFRNQLIASPDAQTALNLILREEAGEPEHHVPR